MSAWFVNKALVRLIAQVRAIVPVIVGTIGDAAHSNRPSDHNPKANGSVDAADFMIGGVFTVSKAQWLVDTLVRFADPRISYIIYNRRIWKASTSWIAYNGNDPHTNHVHVSVNGPLKTRDTMWKLAGKVPSMITVTGTWPILKEGDKDDDFDGYNMIQRIQKQVVVDPDGEWGPLTTAAIKRVADVDDASPLTETIYRKLFGLSS